MTPRVNGARVAARGAATPWYRAGAAPVPVAVYQPKGAADLAASYVNLANPGTYDATWSGASPSWTVGDGWQCSVGNYLRTGVVPVDGDWMIARYTNAANPVYAAGVNNAGATIIFGIGPLFGATSYAFYGALRAAVIGAANNGVMASTKAQGYYNGASMGMAAGTALSSLPEMYIGARNNNNSTVENSGTIYIQAFAYYRPGSQPTADQVAAVSAAMALL